jgi:hypothetical protein
MATQNFETLRARVQALGYQLWIDGDRQLVVDLDPVSAGRNPEVVFVHQSDSDDELVDWIEHEEADDSGAEAVRAAIAALPERSDNDEPTAKELLGQCYHHLHGIEQVASMLYDNGDQAEEAYGAAHTIKHMAAAAYELVDTAKERMGTQVTPAVIAMSKRLKKLGRKLLADATDADVFTVVKMQPGPVLTWEMFIVSLDEIDAWIKREGLEGGAA